MSVASATRGWVRKNFRVDQQAIEMAAVFAAVLVATLLLAIEIGPTETSRQAEAFGGGSSGQAAAGATWAVAEVFVAGGLLGCIFLWKRLPKWVRKTLAYNIFAALAIYLGYDNATTAPLYAVIGVFVVPYTLYRVFDNLGVWWVANNLIVLALAVGAGLTLGLVFGVPGLIIAFVVLTVYDYLFADRKSWMFDLGASMVKLRLPVVFLRPKVYRFDWDDVADAFSKESDDGEDVGAWGVGMADLMLPAGFVAALVTTSTPGVPQIGIPATVVVLLGIVGACFRLRHKMLTTGSGAGLPALASGALASYAVVMPFAVLL